MQMQGTAEALYRSKRHWKKMAADLIGFIFYAQTLQPIAARGKETRQKKNLIYKEHEGKK